MAPPSLLHLLNARGLEPRIVNGSLRVGPRERLDDELRSLIREHRDGLVALLSPPASGFAPVVAPPEPDGLVLGFKTVSAADYLDSVRAAAAHNATVLARPEP